MKNKSRNIWYDVLAISIVAIWGLTFISTSVLLEWFSPAQIFATRFVIAYAGMWIFCHDRIWADNIKDELTLVVAGLAGGSLYFLSENTALKVSHEASSISFIVCTTPLVTALLAIALKKKGARMTLPLAIGSAVALAGIAMVMFNGSALQGIPALGYFLAMGASLTWAIYTVTVVDLTDHYGSAFITRKVFFYGLLTIIPFLFFSNEPMNWQAFGVPKVLLNIVFLSVVASLGCYALWTPVMKKLGSIRASNYIYLNPVFTLVGAIILLGEKLTWLSGLGCAVTLLGVWLAGRPSATPETKQ